MLAVQFDFAQCPFSSLAFCSAGVFRQLVQRLSQPRAVLNRSPHLIKSTEQLLQLVPVLWQFHRKRNFQIPRVKPYSFGGYDPSAELHLACKETAFLGSFLNPTSQHTYNRTTMSSRRCSSFLAHRKNPLTISATDEPSYLTFPQVKIGNGYPNLSRLEEFV